MPTKVYYASNNSYANPSLKPEHIQSYEAVIEQQLDTHIRLTLNAYFNQITDLISQQTNQSTGYTFYVNSDSANTHGAEAEIEGQWAHGLRARLSYAWQETHDDATGAELTNSPRHLAKLNVLVPFFDDKASLGLEAQYVSSLRVAEGENTSGYFVANATLFSHRLLDHLELSASLYNMFDTRYSYAAGPGFLEDTLPASGRSFRVKATYSF